MTPASRYIVCEGREIHVTIGDCTDYPTLARLFEESEPDAVIHYAEQPSAPFSMMGYDNARRTLRNNLEATFNTIWACLEHAPAERLVFAPDCGLSQTARWAAKQKLVNMVQVYLLY